MFHVLRQCRRSLANRHVALRWHRESRKPAAGCRSLKSLWTVMQASFRFSHVNLTLSQEALGLRLFDPSAYLQMPCHLRLSFSGSAASAMAVDSLSSKSSYFGHQLRFRPGAALRVRSEQEQCFGVLCKPKVTFPAMVLLASGSRRRAFPPLPSLSDTFKETGLILRNDSESRRPV